MDINKLLNGVECACGRIHKCDIRYVYIENGAIAKLEEICGEQQKLLIVADENTFAAAGKQVCDALSHKEITKVIFTGTKVLVPNEEAIQAVTEKLNGVEMIVGIGSGVIQDLCKYVSFENGIPYIIVATAPSMDGYASNGAAMITGGMKVTYNATLPVAILADTKVLANAPMDMLKAGYGDIIGKFSALNDWKLSHCVNGEYYCDYIYTLTMEQVQKTLSLADGILTRNEESVKAMMEALVVIGILMSFAGSSRPASGSEHHLSHFFEITGILDGTEYFSHGIDVVYSTVVTAMMRQAILERSFPRKIFRQSEEAYKSEMTRVYKGSADGCIALQKKVGNYTKDRLPVYLEKETEIRRILAEMPTPEEIRNMLSLVKMDVTEFYQFYGKEKLTDAVRYAKELKDRYTVLWLYYDLFGDDYDV